MERKTSANKKTSHALNLALIFLPGSANSWLFLEREQLISKARAMHLDVVTGQAPDEPQNRAEPDWSGPILASSNRDGTIYPARPLHPGLRRARNHQWPLARTPE